MKPTAAPSHFPYQHRSMAEVMAEEERQREAPRSLRRAIQKLEARMTRQERIEAIRRQMAQEAKEASERRRLANQSQGNPWIEWRRA